PRGAAERRVTAHTERAWRRASGATNRRFTVIAFMGGGPARREPVGEVGGAQPGQRRALSG
ncbi:hypothetical protein DD577_28800, partial [Klebsiella pneumoniae]